MNPKKRKDEEIGALWRRGLMYTGKITVDGVLKDIVIKINHNKRLPKQPDLIIYLDGKRM